MRRLVVAVVVVLSLAGCGSPSEPATGPTSPPPSSRTGAAEVQLRVVGLAADVKSPAPPATWAHRYDAFTCGSGAAAQPSVPGDYLLACSASKDKYLLDPATWHGTVEAAVAEVPGQQTAWAVNVTLPDGGAKALRKLSRELTDSGGQVAIVIDGKVVSAAGFNGVITDGEVQITPFTEAAARALADHLGGS